MRHPQVAAVDQDDVIGPLGVAGHSHPVLDLGPADPLEHHVTGEHALGHPRAHLLAREDVGGG
ncbi:MAG: hypothetical protein KBG28_06805, partial [Kofleriaceae bacterium]|nr:hypothetical protein [Kofleriaceae bacterium]